MRKIIFSLALIVAPTFVYGGRTAVLTPDVTGVQCGYQSGFMSVATRGRRSHETDQAAEWRHRSESHLNFTPSPDGSGGFFVAGGVHKGSAYDFGFKSGNFNYGEAIDLCTLALDAGFNPDQPKTCYLLAGHGNPVGDRAVCAPATADEKVAAGRAREARRAVAAHEDAVAGVAGARLVLARAEERLAALEPVSEAAEDAEVAGLLPAAAPAAVLAPLPERRVAPVAHAHDTMRSTVAQRPIVMPALATAAAAGPALPAYKLTIQNKRSAGAGKQLLIDEQYAGEAAAAVFALEGAQEKVYPAVAGGTRFSVKRNNPAAKAAIDITRDGLNWTFSLRDNSPAEEAAVFSSSDIGSPLPRADSYIVVDNGGSGHRLLAELVNDSGAIYRKTISAGGSARLPLSSAYQIHLVSHSSNCGAYIWLAAPGDVRVAILDTSER